MHSDIRVRFAPSPTGLLHIGGLRTALYNYLFAKRNNGTFVLRIEDTDRERFVEEAEADILESLNWAGLDVDEGPDGGPDGGPGGGKYGPYYQSQRRELYRKYAGELIQAGHAYYAFDTPEQLEELRSRDGGTARYDMHTRDSMANSLTLPGDEVKRRLDAGEAHVIRLKVPSDKRIAFDDAVRGSVSFASEEVDDQVLVKSDGMPTYHLANVVDDHEMQISHVIRGEEWLPSTPKHILLYEFFGWQPPTFAHLPLILSPTGGKLSKRNADRAGIPVSVRQYREAGYEPEALINFLAFLGWNPGDEREVFSLDELAAAFSLDRVGSSGVSFSMDKLRWYNENHLRLLDESELLSRAQPALTAKGYDQAGEAYLRDVASLMRERIVFASDLATECAYFFEAPDSYEEAGVKKRWKEDSPALLTAYADRLEALDNFSAEAAETVLREVADEHEAGAGRIIHPTRLALSGVTFGPGLFEMMELIGKDECVLRMRKAVESLP